jgi:hypothetical protein
MGSKLDGWSQVGQWVRFDEESCGHCIYWPNCYSVTAERSVKFDIDNVVLTCNVPLQTAEIHCPNIPTQHPSPEEVGPTTENEVTMIEKCPEPEGDIQMQNREEASSKHTHKASEYVKRFQ